MSLFSTKPISRIIAEAEETGSHTLKKTLSAVDLTMLGIGGIIGTGIFVLDPLPCYSDRNDRRCRRRIRAIQRHPYSVDLGDELSN